MNDSNSSPMPISRQLRYQKQCRDNWKEKALQKQQKVREYVQLTRSLKKSRDNWKTRAKQAEQRVKDLEQQLANCCSKSLTRCSACLALVFQLSRLFFKERVSWTYSRTFCCFWRAFSFQLSRHCF